MESIERVRNAIGCNERLANDLLTLAGGDTLMLLDCYRRSKNIEQTKALIIDARFKKLICSMQ